MTNKYDFLTAPRFWAMVLGSASTVLVTSFGTEPWYISLGKFLGLLSVGFVTVRTIDRAVDSKSTNTTVSIPSNVSTVTATTDSNTTGTL